jgi:hypothetical protein
MNQPPRLCRPARKHKLAGACQLRNFGIGNCLRILLARKQWCLAFDRFNMDLERQQPGSLFASIMCSRVCGHFIPGWDSMERPDRAQAESLFLTTGQCCSKEAMAGKKKTVLLFVEQTSDAFQPYKRRQHSTWVQALRCGPPPHLTPYAAVAQHGPCLCRVMNMVQDFASTRLACVIQAILDGPQEHSEYDSVVHASVEELSKYAPPVPGGDEGPVGAPSPPTPAPHLV